MPANDLYRILAWAVGTGLTASFVALTIRTAVRWHPIDRRLRQPNRHRVAAKEFRRSLATALFSGIAAAAHAAYYWPILFQGIEDTGWSAILGTTLTASAALCGLEIGPVLYIAVVYSIVNRRAPRVTSANLWVAALISLELAALCTATTIFEFNWVEVALLVILALLLPFYRALLDAVKVVGNWIHIAFRRLFEAVRVLAISLFVKGRNLQARIARASEILRGAVERSEARIADATPSARVAEFEALLDEAEQREAAGDDTIVRKRKRPQERRRSPGSPTNPDGGTQ